MDAQHAIGVLQAEVAALQETVKNEREDNREFRKEVREALASLKDFNVKVDTGGTVLKTLLAISVSLGALAMYVSNLFHIKP